MYFKSDGIFISIYIILRTTKILIILIAFNSFITISVKTSKTKYKKESCKCYAGFSATYYLVMTSDSLNQ
ncbi:MAG: hypothetical protein EDM69_07920 [Chlorobiota bacterium]|nr:MAG: hypothetical protein EDM69_07920 [Chlorobiota bacterium]MCE7953248.1 hypothetical protein [Chlorobi bacterium CHB7]OQY76505.1 MAG: hypothetical protein B6D43_10020 [Ignavibacteriales bacterium UTCHB1]RIK50112.1 MAG: hypothetical protein DCC60_01735 [Ignavibacteriota bacterium]